MGNKCIVKDCPNHDDQGGGFDLAVIGKRRGEGSLHWICSPCWHMITKGEIGPGETFVHKIRNDSVFEFKTIDDKTIRIYKGPIEKGMKFWWARNVAHNWAVIEVTEVSMKCPDDPWVYTRVLHSDRRDYIGNIYGNETSHFRECVEPYEERNTNHGKANDLKNRVTEPSPS